MVAVAARRVFFALWPSEQVRARLHEFATGLHAATGGQPVARGNLHQTLVFVGDVAAERVGALVALGATLEVPPFVVELGTVGYWRHNRIVWAAPLAAPQPLLDLVCDLEARLAAADVPFDRRPYKPHVTLLRDAGKPAVMPALRLSWPVAGFALVASTGGPRGVRYEVIAHMPFRF